MDPISPWSSFARAITSSGNASLASSASLGHSINAATCHNHTAPSPPTITTTTTTTTIFPKTHKSKKLDTQNVKRVSASSGQKETVVVDPTWRLKVIGG